MSCILTIGTFTLAMTLKLSRNSSYFPSKVRTHLVRLLPLEERLTISGTRTAKRFRRYYRNYSHGPGRLSVRFGHVETVCATDCHGKVIKNALLVLWMLYRYFFPL